MKGRIFRMALCALLVVSMVIAPVCASSATKNVLALLKTNVDGGRLREGPSSEYEVIRSLKKGEKVFYAGHVTSSFCLVRTSTGEIGYIYRGFLSDYGNVRADQVYYATADSVRVYKEPSTGSGRAGYLTNSEHVLVLRTSGTWAYIRTLNGYGGYVQMDYLESLT